jgi:hypothetical protein
MNRKFKVPIPNAMTKVFNMRLAKAIIKTLIIDSLWGLLLRNVIPVIQTVICEGPYHKTNAGRG